MKAMLSQPMAGKSEKEIIATRERAILALKERGYETVNTLFTDEWYSQDAMQQRGVVQIPLCFLAKSLENMSLCHAAYFCKGWEMPVDAALSTTRRKHTDLMSYTRSNFIRGRDRTQRAEGKCSQKRNSNGSRKQGIFATAVNGIYGTIPASSTGGLAWKKAAPDSAHVIWNTTTATPQSLKQELRYTLPNPHV